MKLRLYGRDYTNKFTRQETRYGIFECICACTGILCFIPLVSIPESRYGRYWTNQGIIILLIELLCVIVGLIVGGILTLLGMIPYVGIVFDILKVIVIVILSGVSLFYIIWGIIDVCRGKARDVPFLGYMRFIK